MNALGIRIRYCSLPVPFKNRVELILNLVNKIERKVSTSAGVNESVQMKTTPSRIE